MFDQKELNLALDKTKIALMSTPDSVFFTTVCLSLRHVFDETVPTARTNGLWVKYSPEFFMKLSRDERVFLMLHETLHCAYMHMTRADALNLDKNKANVAADHVINLQLIERGFHMPAGGLADPKYKGMSMEEVYKLLPDDPPSAPWEDMESGGDGVSSKEIEQQMADILVKASIQSKLAGEKPGAIPGEIEIFLNKLLNPKLPWTTILRKYLQSYNKDDYSWKRPNRRYMPDYYLPSLHSEGLMDLTIAIDASGSVSDEDFLQFTSDIHSIFKMMKPKKITLIHFDHGIRGIDTLNNLQDLSKVKFTGRGGTSIEPVLEWVNQNKPQLLLVFTDGEFTYPAMKTKSDLIWLIHNNPKWTAPQGKVIHYTMKD